VIQTLLAIDPGLKTGWAFFVAAGGWHVAGAGVVAPDDPTWSPLIKYGLVVIENPQIYPHGKARPSDLLKLARVVGRYEERFAGSPIELVAPRDWKGTVPKAIMLARIEAALDERTRGACAAYKGGYRDNLLDAVGMGFWAIQQPFMRRV
jgi:hypothetical protein